MFVYLKRRRRRRRRKVFYAR